VGAAPPAPVDEPDDEEAIDLSELSDVPPEAVKGPDEQLAEAFPGSSWVIEER